MEVKMNKNCKQRHVLPLDCKILVGQVGPTGPTGAILSKSAYLITYNHEINPNGIEISPLENLPIERVELDTNNLITLNTPSLKNIASKSYFSNSIVTIVIDYL